MKQQVIARRYVAYLQILWWHLLTGGRSYMESHVLMTSFTTVKFNLRSCSQFPRCLENLLKTLSSLMNSQNARYFPRHRESPAKSTDASLRKQLLASLKQPWHRHWNDVQMQHIWCTDLRQPTVRQLRTSTRSALSIALRFSVAIQRHSHQTCQAK